LKLILVGIFQAVFQVGKPETGEGRPKCMGSLDQFGLPMKGFYHRTFLFVEGIRKPDHESPLPPVKKRDWEHLFIKAGEFE
jgi:hypothetical protein